MLALAEKIIDGYRMTREDDCSVFQTADLEELCRSADAIRQELCGSRLSLCSISNGRSGSCSEDCSFCAQSARYNTGIEEYSFLETEDFIRDCGTLEGIHRYSIVTAGRGLHGEDFEKAIHAFQALNERYSVSLCASFGFETKEELLQLKAAGVTAIHENLETSRRFFPEICTTHTYDDKVQVILLAKSLGLDVCSGGIIGMGEYVEDRLDMAFSLAELNISSIPINILKPIPGTLLEGREPLSREEILRTIAMFRFINPEAFVRIGAGRDYFPDSGKELFCSGANAAITGDMLTTTGSNLKQDIRMLRDLGYDCETYEKTETGKRGTDA